MESILVSWLGRTDLRAISESDQVGIGPIAQALRTDRFAQLDLLCDCSTDEADTYLNWLRLQTDARIIPHPIILPSPTDFDAIYLEQAMQTTGGNKTRAAHLLGFANPTTLNNWLRKHGVEP